ncbi:MAG: YfhO family protein [Candidatus Aureabacteria bacterium]|nr:YfhO family protein [Candidatus Auribacterota bacterium]
MNRTFPKIFSFWPYLLLLVLALGVFHEAVFPPLPSWVISRPEGDVGTLYYYWRAYGFAEMNKGTVPLWNPDIFCGVPFAAYPESALFYPPNLIFLLLPVASALNASFLLHFLLLLIFQYLYLRRIDLSQAAAILGAAALGLSAPVILHIHAGHLSNICALAWVPLVFLALEDFLRKRRLISAALAGFLCGLQLLSGHAQYVYYTLLLGGLYLLLGPLLEFRSWRKSALTWCGGVCLYALFAAGIAAVQIFPAGEISRESFRQTAGIAWAANFSLPPLNLVTFLFPDALGDGAKSYYWGRYYFWEMCAYLGIVPLGLALAGVFLKRDRTTLCFVLLAALALLLALGFYTPLFAFLYRYLPGFGLFRGSAKLLFFAAFFLSILSARGAEAVFRSPAGKKIPRRLIAGSFAVISLSAWLFLVFSPRSPPAWWRDSVESELLTGRHYDIVVPGQPSWWRDLMRETPPESDYPRFVKRLVEESPFAPAGWEMFRKSLARLAGLSLALALVLGLAPARFLPPVLLVLVLIELVPWARRFAAGFDGRTCLWPSGEEKFFRSRTEPYRYLSLDPGDLNRGMLEGFPCLLGYQADVSLRFLEYISASQGTSARPEELLPMIEKYSPLLDLLNWKYLIAPKDAVRPESGFRQVFAAGEREIWENARAIPRALISARAETVSGRDALLRRLSRPGYDPREYILIEEAAPFPALAGGAGEAGEARIVESSAGGVRVEAELSAPGWLLLNDAFSPGWKASADGKESRIYRANYLMRAVFLGEGKHRVVFSYRPLSVKIGGAVSVLSVLVLAAWAIRSRRR